MTSPKPRPSILFTTTVLIPFLLIPFLLQPPSLFKPSRALSPRPPFQFHPSIKAVHINIGPNTTPIRPPNPTTAVLAIEANVAIAHFLREKFQKDPALLNRFFVINCAIAGAPRANSFSVFHHYNRQGLSSSLSTVKRPQGKLPYYGNRTMFDPSENFGPGPGGMDFVPVLSLDAVLEAVPSRVRIAFLQTDTQGFDLQVIQSASQRNLRKVERIQSETYLPGVEDKKYEGVVNDLHRDWVPYMRKMGFRLTNPTDKKNMEYDAVWERVEGEY